MKVRVLLAVLSLGIGVQAAEFAPPQKAFVVKLVDGYEAATAAKVFLSQGGIGDKALDVILHDWSLETVQPVFCRDGHPPRHPELFKKLGLNRYVLLGWGPRAAQRPPYILEEVLGQLRKADSVEEAELNGVGKGAMTPDDPEFPAQWHHAMIQSTTAWDMVTGSTNLLIAVIDSGISPDNDDLDYSLISNHWDYVEDDAAPQDEYGHGTHVAGIIAAQTDNTTLVSGLAWNCRLLNCRVLDENNNGLYSDWAAAIEDAADLGADVLNLSLGGTDVSAVLSNACTYAYGLDCFLSVAMMNHDGPVVAYPAAYPTVCAVGGTDEADTRATGGWWGSNYGPHIDIVAPGNNIPSTLWEGTASWSGTSMATPMVSALAALILEIRPDFSNMVVQAFIQATADDEVGDPAEDTEGFDEFMGWGRIRFDEAVRITEISTTCTLTCATAAVPPSAAKKMLKPYFWLRDRKLKQTPTGKRLITDYYRASKTIAPVMNRNPELMCRFLICSQRYAPLIEQLMDRPSDKLIFPRSLWKESCAIADQLTERLDPKTKDQVRPWLERGKKDPVGLLRQLGISIVWKEDQK
jgi:subtilisin family serine protease